MERTNDTLAYARERIEYRLQQAIHAGDTAETQKNQQYQRGKEHAYRDALDILEDVYRL